MTGKRYLIVNADDFGQSFGVNGGIIETHEHGIVTSASLMVRWPAAVEAANYAKNRRDFSLGLHLDLGEWAYRNETWTLLYQVVALNEAAAVGAEVSRQLAAFRKLVGRNPSHIDSHQHVHLREPVRSVVLDAAQKLNIPVRELSSQIRHCGRFYGQTAEGAPYPDGICAEALIGLLAQLQPGITELGCHPGLGEDLDTMYVRERRQEVRVLCDVRIHSTLAQMEIELRSFDAVPGIVPVIEIAAAKP